MCDNDRMSGAGRLLKRTRLAFTLAIFCLCGLGAFAWWSSKRYSDSIYWVGHTNRVIHSIDEALLGMVDLEAGVRGYVITGQEVHLEPYSEGRTRVKSAVDQLEGLVRDNPDQVDRLQRAQQLIERRLDVADKVVAARRRSSDEAERLVMEGQGKAQMDQIRAVFDEMTEEESGLLQGRTSEYSLGGRLAAAAIALAGAVALMLTVLWGASLMRDVRRRIEAEESLRLSEENLAITLHSIGDAVLATDAEGRITRMNPIAEQLTGWKFEEAQGRSIDEVFVIINESTRNPAPIPVKDVLTTGQIHGLANHTVLISKDGRETAIADSAAPIRNRDDETVGVVLVFRDCSEERIVADLQSQLAAIVESSQDAIVGRDVEHRTTTWNRAAERMFGYAFSEVRGIVTPNFVPPESADEAARALEKVLRGERVPHYETIRLAKGGRPVNVSVSISPILDEDGVLIGTSTIYRDITELLRAEEERDRFFDLSLDIMCISSADGHFKRVNPAFSEILGWSTEELLTKPYLEFVHPDDLAITREEVARQVERGETVYSFENRYLHRDGTWRTLAWKSVPQPGGLMYAAARDVTELRQTINSLDAAKAEAERANAAKSDFLSNMSHELRTPLNAVIGFAQLLEMRNHDPSTQEATQSILKAGRHLLDLINEILDVARIEAGKMTLSVESVALGAMIDHAVELVSPLAGAKGVSVVIEGELCRNLHVAADRQRLIQVLINLLTNAVKYNRDHGKVVIRCHDGGDGVHRVEIQDTGRGIDARGRERLFQPFERGNHMEEGTGLGLALSRRLMQLMSGDIDLVKTGSEGSTFGITLKGAEAPGVEALGESRDKALLPFRPSRPVRIVYVEDNLSNLQLLEQVFASVGNIELIPAMTASLGLEMVNSHLPDVVLLDLHLPDMEGIDVFLRIKASDRTSHIPVVVLSADATESQINRLLRLGVKSYLTKPVDLQLLLAEIGEIDRFKTEKGRG